MLNLLIVRNFHENTQEIIDIEDKYFINTFNRVPIVLDHGEGVKVWDIDGNEYLDFLAGIAVNCLGHNHPKLVKAIQEQAEKLIHISSIYYNEPATIYAKRLVDATNFDRIFFANSGAEAASMKSSSAEIHSTEGPS